MPKYAINATTLNAFARAGYAGEKSFAEEVELIKLNAVKGVLPPAYSLAYRAGVVCAKAKLKNTKANRELVIKDRAKRKDDWAAAGNRLTRRVKEAQIANGTKAGRKRGSTNKTTPAATTAKAETMPKATAPAVPTLATPAEFTMWLRGEAARILTVTRKAGKAPTVQQQNAIAALVASCKED